MAEQSYWRTTSQEASTVFMEVIIAPLILRPDITYDNGV
jgi:hypothetical protein